MVKKAISASQSVAGSQLCAGCRGTESNMLCSGLNGASNEVATGSVGL